MSYREKEQAMPASHRLVPIINNRRLNCHRLTLRLGLAVFGGTLLAIAFTNLLTFYGATQDASSLLHVHTETVAAGGRGESKLEKIAAAYGINKSSSVTQENEESSSTYLRGEKAVTTTKSIGSQVDLKEALRKTKERIRAEEEERQRLERGGTLGEADQKKLLLLEEEKKAITIHTAPSSEEAALAPHPSDESGIIVPIEPAGEKAIRRPITGRPPLHRLRNETQIQKILVTLSSIDRGQRIADTWRGDKLETILVIMSSLKAMCERGFDVTIWFVTAWKISLESKRIEEALTCDRIGGPIDIRYWDDFKSDIEGLLSSRHRLAVKEVIDDYDLFTSIEDDIHLTPITVDAFVDASNRLALTPGGNDLLPGFSRKEHDAHRHNTWSLWETDAEDYETEYLPGGAGYFATVGGNVHQAMWMATREQLYHYDDRCRDGFFNIKNPEGAEWVEFWSGALQLYDNDYCNGLRKVIPVSTFRNFTVWHMTDSKLYSRGKGVAPVEDVVMKLEQQREEMEKRRQVMVEAR